MKRLYDTIPVKILDQVQKNIARILPLVMSHVKYGHTICLSTGCCKIQGRKVKVQGTVLLSHLICHVNYVQTIQNVWFFSSVALRFCIGSLKCETLCCFSIADYDYALIFFILYAFVF